MPNFYYDHIQLVPEILYFIDSPLQIFLNKVLPACHRCPNKNRNESVTCENEYQPLIDYLKTPSEDIVALSNVNICPNWAFLA